MPISITCSNCDKTMKVPDATAGKKVRCPACKAVIAVPSEDEKLAEEETSRKKSPAVKKEAPPPLPPSKKRRDEDDDDEVDEDDDRPPRKKKRRDDDDEDEEEDDLPRKKKKKKRRYADDLDVRRRSYSPHRGAMILSLGILSIVLSCIPLLAWILGAIAYNMANTDLLEIDRRRMDPAGSGTTRAGRICGMIGVILGVLACGFNLVVLLSGTRQGF